MWKDSRPKVKLEVISMEIVNGGLKAPVYETQAKSLKLSYVKRILSTDKTVWKSCFQAFMTGATVEDVFSSRCCLNNSVLCHIPKFYQEIIAGWAQLQAMVTPETAADIATEYLWFNPYITINGKSIFYKHWYSKGIKRIRDLLDDNNVFIGNQEIKNKYDLDVNFLEYYGLRSAIPYHWKVMLRQNTDLQHVRVDEVNPMYVLPSKRLYCKLLKEPQEII
jgi:hypothetical protein